MIRTAVVIQAYGTSPNGKEPSQMDRDVVKLAKRLAISSRSEAVIFQGGYSFNNGPTEAQLMSEYFADVGVASYLALIEERESLNTLEGAIAILKIAKQKGFDKLLVIGESFHIKRIEQTYHLVFAGSGIALSFHSATTPFGPNSQERLTSAWRWWPWELVARIATPVLIFLNK